MPAVELLLNDYQRFEKLQYVKSCSIFLALALALADVLVGIGAHTAKECWCISGPVNDRKTKIYRPKWTKKVVLHPILEPLTHYRRT